MEFIDKIINKAKQNKKRIILPEADDDRILIAAEKAAKENVAEILLLGKKEHILKKAEELSLVFNENIKIIDYLNTENKENFNYLANRLCEIRKGKNLKLEEAKEILKENIYYGMMMLSEDLADGLVAGAVHTTKDILKPALQIIKTKKESDLVSSYFIIDTKKKEFGEDGIMLFADCGLNISPNEQELASIAVESGRTFEKMVNKKANIAFLSFATLGSANSETAEKVRNALNIAKGKAPDLNMDGEMQLDAAIIKKVAETKAKESSVAGKANVLIFPDIDSGNIGYKMAQYMSGGKAYGPLLQGINKPVNDLSRGSTADEIYGVIAITATE